MAELLRTKHHIDKLRKTRHGNHAMIYRLQREIGELKRTLNGQRLVIHATTAPSRIVITGLGPLALHPKLIGMILPGR